MSNYYGDTEYDPSFDDSSRAAPKRTGRTVRMAQIIAGQWSGDMGDSYSVVGLGTDGNVYRYDARDGGWLPWSMEVLDPVMEVRRRR